MNFAHAALVREETCTRCPRRAAPVIPETPRLRRRELSCSPIFEFDEHHWELRRQVVSLDARGPNKAEKPRAPPGPFAEGQQMVMKRPLPVPAQAQY